MLQPLAIAVIGGIAGLDGSLAGGNAGRPVLSGPESIRIRSNTNEEGSDAIAVIAAAAFAAEGYKVLNKIKIGGTGGWDYTAVDSADRRCTPPTAPWWKWWT